MSSDCSPEDPVCVSDRILNAAEVVAARDGVANLTLEAVAREAGVSKGGLLYHFPSKSTLITAIVERLATNCEGEQRKALDADQSTDAGRFTRAYLIARVARSEPENFKKKPIHTALIAAAGTDPQFLEPIRKRHRDWQKLLETDGIDPATATIVRLAIDGLCLGAMLGMPVPDGDLRQNVLDRLLAMTRESTKCAASAKDPAYSLNHTDSKE